MKAFDSWAPVALLRYSSEWSDLFRRVASYVDQILKGGSPLVLLTVAINLRNLQCVEACSPAPTRSSNNLLGARFAADAQVGNWHTLPIRWTAAIMSGYTGTCTVAVRHP